MGPAAGPNQPNGPSKPPNAPSGGNIQGAERHQQGRKGSIRPLTDRGRLIQAKTGLVQSILSLLMFTKLEANLGFVSWF